MENDDVYKVKENKNRCLIEGDKYLCMKPCYYGGHQFKEADLITLFNVTTDPLQVKDAYGEWCLITKDLLRECFQYYDVIMAENQNQWQQTDTFTRSLSKTPEKVNHPSYYTWLKDLCGIEVIDITRHMDFCLGSAIKYLLRSGRKSEQGYTNKEKTIEDLQKAIWYINDEITQLQNSK